jgi:hypothetical protein
MNHKTIKGREFNMQAFSDSRGETVAVGNTLRNARGDLLDSKGDVIATSQQIAHEIYNRKSKSGGKTVKLNPMEQEVNRKEVVGADGVARVEITYADGSVEVQTVENSKSANLDFDPPVVPEKTVKKEAK